MAQTKIYTPAGYEALLGELAHMREEREKNKKEISEARSYGDLSENSEYEEAKRNQGIIAGRIAELEEMIKHAVVQDESEIDHTKVSVGSTVRVVNEATGKETVYKLVGSYEVNALAEGVKLISDESPIGSALLGHGAGEVATYHRPDGSTLALRVISVERN